MPCCGGDACCPTGAGQTPAPDAWTLLRRSTSPSPAGALQQMGRYGIFPMPLIPDHRLVDVCGNDTAGIQIWWKEFQ
jgi:hypothetical protein